VRRAIVIAGALAFAFADPARAATPVDLGPGRVNALAAGEGRPYAVLDGNSALGPFTLLRGTARVATFADRSAEFPDVEVLDGVPTVTWGVPISGGEALFAAPGEDPRASVELGFGTGPARLAAGQGGVFATFPDREGDVVVAPTRPQRARGAYDLPAPRALTANAPESRHRPLDAATGAQGLLVLDLVQTRRSTELRVIGTGAPSRPVLTVRGRRDIEAAFAADSRGVTVAYVSSGQIKLARSSGAAWARRVLRSAAARSPTVARARGGDTVAFEQRGEIMVSVRDRVRVVGAGRGTDRAPHAAADPETGRTWVAWTHRAPRGRGEGRLLRVR